MDESDIPRLPQIKKRVTLRDVAEAAGVSVMTVSNVVHQREDLVSAEKRSAVEAEIKRLGYRPNAQARGLRLSQTKTVGMLFLVQDNNFLSSPWTSRMVAGLSNFLGENDFGLLLHRQTPHALSQSHFMRFSQTDALCVMASGSRKERESAYRQLMKLRQPIVAVQEIAFRDTFSDFCIIRQDDRRAGFEIADHALSKGARKIVFIEPDYSFTAMRERWRGALDAARQVSQAVVKRLVTEGEQREEIEKAILPFIRRNGIPDAVIAGNERIAFTAQHTLRQHIQPDRNVPHILTFNAFDLSQLANETIPTIDFPAYDIGVCVAKHLLKRLEAGHFDEREIVFDVKLVIDRP